MSLVKCPKCGCKLVATIRLRARDWSTEKISRHPRARFNHDLAVELFHGGLSMSAIGRQLGVSDTAVREMLRNRGVK